MSALVSAHTRYVASATPEITPAIGWDFNDEPPGVVTVDIGLIRRDFYRPGEHEPEVFKAALDRDYGSTLAGSWPHFKL